jgi:hypothetical protein
MSPFSVSYRFMTAVFSIAGCLGYSTAGAAVEKCKTTLDCAQQAVEAATEANAAVQVMQKRINELEKLMIDFKNASAFAPTTAYWDRGLISKVSGGLDLRAQAIGPQPPNGWPALRVFFGKTFNSIPLVIASTGQYKDSTIGNIIDVRQDHFDIYLRILPNGAADANNIPLYFAIFPPAQ